MDATASLPSMNDRQLLKALRAFRSGDFTTRLPTDLAGIDGAIAETFNDVVELNQSLVKELTRLSTAVGKEGKISQRGILSNAKGGWQACIQAVNSLIGDMAYPTTEVARVIGAVAKGDLSQTMVLEVDERPLRGEFLRIGKTVNTMVGQLSSFASEVTRVAREVGTEGKLGGQADVKGVAGTWKDLTDNVNLMATNLTGQVRNIAEVTTAVANGDLSKKITVDVKGEILELKDTINTMVDQLSSFASEVSRVAREVGTDGNLGGQAHVKGVAGTWKDLTDNVNMMATNLTNQVRGIADVVTAVARGDLTHKLTVDAKGEIAALADTINGMIVTLATFGDQVTNVAREVGIDGKLGGQAKVPGAAGLWRDLTDNVNQLAANLTTQVRAIAEVATAVTKGDLTRSITVEASGEVAALKDNINEMIRNLEETTLKNTEQDWLKTNLARFTRLLQGERDLVTVSNLVLSELAPLIGAQKGLFYLARQLEKEGDEETVLELLATYAFHERKALSKGYRLREGLVGQCALERQRILLTDVPPDYLRINSGLGEAPPRNIVVLPVLFEGEIQAVLELASFNQFSETHLLFLDQLMESIGIVLNTIATNMRTEDLLKQSQRLTSELQIQQEELRNTNDRLEQQAASLRQSEDLLRTQQEELQRKNEELQEKAQLLALEKKQVEATNKEVEKAKQAVEEKAEQLALTSKYKSEFLANMSHELRTPLNSLMVLSKLLVENTDGNLTEKQVEFARTIHSSGSNLLALINEILDLSKIESGAMRVELGELQFGVIEENLRRTFAPVAAEKGLDFVMAFDTALPTQMYTDSLRLQQVLFNLLSNAFKFTASGSVSVRAELASGGWSAQHPVLNTADKVVAFTIADTGIGISPENQKIIFEAFQQGDGSTNRKYGGTGLGLSISREIARLLGAEIVLKSTPGEGSSFTLYLPVELHAATGHDRSAAEVEPDAATTAVTTMLDDRRQLDGSAPAVLIIEDDLAFAQLLLEVIRELGMKGVVVGRGREVLQMASDLKIDAISLDIGLSDMDGWALLDLLKHESATRHIPVHILSTEEHLTRGLSMGICGFTGKPAEREKLLASYRRLKDLVVRQGRRLVVVGGAGAPAGAIALLERLPDTVVRIVRHGRAIEEVEAQQPDCIVVDLSRAPAQGIRFLSALEKAEIGRSLPVVVYAPKKLSATNAAALQADMPGINKRVANALSGLLDGVTLLLHLPIEGLPQEIREPVEKLKRTDAVLAGAKVAIIDDDIRNIFSLTSVLERYQVEVMHAEDGKSGIELVRSTPDLDVVLVDIMMPEMDGYETIRRIRSLGDGMARLPLIAVTAKAMKGDRQKCLDAGASDYLAKPVDPDQLISKVRTWLHRMREAAE